MILSRETKETYKKLNSCIWFFNVSKKRMEWANDAAIKLWNAKNLTELLRRDFSDISDTALLRLKRYEIQHKNGKPDLQQEYWTFYPNGKPASVQLWCKDIFKKNDDTIFFFESLFSEESRISGSELRSLEAIRHTTVNVCVTNVTGKILFQNPRDEITFGQTELKERFADTASFEKLLSMVMGGHEYSAIVEVKTLKGNARFGMDARLSKDPISGENCIIVNQINRTVEIKAIEEAEMERRRADLADLKAETIEIKKELELTQAVQNLLIPKFERISNSYLSISGKIVPAALCSGDWWWIHKNDSRTLIFSIDVMGHGAHSAMVTALLASAIKFIVEKSPVTEVEDMLVTINDHLYSTCNGEHLATLICFEVDHAAQTAQSFFNGAQPFFQQSGTQITSSFCKPSSLIGVHPDNFRCSTTPIDFGLGKRIVIVSDGFLEAEDSNGRVFGRRRAAKIFKNLLDAPPETVVEESLSQLRTHLNRHQFDDDITVIVVDKH